MYLITYDIASDRLRSRVAKELENFGKRVQYSVFECSIDRNTFKKVYAKLVCLVDNQAEAGIRIYSIDKDAMEKTLIIGDSDIREESEVVII